MHFLSDITSMFSWGFLFLFPLFFIILLIVVFIHFLIRSIAELLIPDFLISNFQFLDFLIS